MNNKTSLNKQEMEKFAKLANEWWDENGKFKPLHKFNPIRLKYIKEQICQKFNRNPKEHKPLKGLKILDVGCGGGLLCEPIARMGAEVIGIDAAKINIKIAQKHAEENKLKIKYQNILVENIKNEKFDVILNMEVVEHVENIEFFIQQCCRLIKKNGIMFIATINRTWKAKSLAIFMAENILQWLPKGTHQYEKLVKPQEIENIIQKEKMKIIHKTGIVYNPWQDKWKLNKNMEVNYIVVIEENNYRNS